MSGNFAIKGWGGRTPNGKCHLKFPFWFFDYLPKNDAAKPMLLPGKEKDLEEPRAPDPEWRQSVSPAYRSNIDLMIVFLTSSSGVK